MADQLDVQFHQASVDASGLPPSSQDFGTSLGVLHHVPDTAPRPDQPDLYRCWACGSAVLAAGLFLVCGGVQGSGGGL